MAYDNIDDVEEYFQPILQRIETLFSLPLVVDSHDEEWVRFHLAGLVDQQAIVTIEMNNRQILLGTEQRTFQILCAWNAADGKGLWLHYLDDASMQGEFRAGVWFY